MTDQQEIISSGTPHEVHLPEGSNTAVHKTATPLEPQVRNTLVNPDEEVEVEVVEVVKSVSHSQEDAIRAARMTPPAAAGHEADRFLNVDTAERPDHMVSDEGAQEPQTHAPTQALPLTQVMSDLPSLDLPANEATFAATVGFSASAPHAPGAPTPAAQEVTAQADTEINSAEVVALVDTEVSSGDVVAQADAEVSSGDVVAQADAEVSSGDVVAQADTEVPSGEVAAQADAEVTQPEADARVDAEAAPAQALAPAQFLEEMNFPARVVKLKMANDQVRGQIEKLEKPLFPPLPVETPAAPKGKGKEPAAKPAKPAKGH